MRFIFSATALLTCFLTGTLTSAQLLLPSSSSSPSPSSSLTLPTTTWNPPSSYHLGAGPQASSILSSWDAAHPEESYWATQTGTNLRDLATETPGRVWRGSTVGSAMASETETARAGVDGNATVQVEDSSTVGSSSGAPLFNGVWSVVRAIVFGRAVLALGGEI